MLGRRAVRKRLAALASGAVPEECGPELDRLVEMAEIAAGMLAPPHASALGPAWRGLDTDFDQLERVYAWAQRLRTETAACATDTAKLLSLRVHLRQLVGEGADLLTPAGAVGRVLQHLVTSYGDALQALQAVADCSRSDIAAHVSPGQDDWLLALSAHLAGWSTASRLIQDWCAWRGIVADSGISRTVSPARCNGSWDDCPARCGARHGGKLCPLVGQPRGRTSAVFARLRCRPTRDATSNAFADLTPACWICRPNLPVPG